MTTRTTQIFQLLNMFGTTENANISLIFPEIALNHCCPNAKSLFPTPTPPNHFCNQDFYQAQVDSVSNRTADGCMSNTSQEDPPTAAELDKPRHSLPMGTTGLGTTGKARPASGREGCSQS